MIGCFFGVVGLSEGARLAEDILDGDVGRRGVLAYGVGCRRSFCRMLILLRNCTSLGLLAGLLGRSVMHRCNLIRLW